MQLTIVRHGQSVWNDQRLIQGQQDPPLNEAGRRQAQQVAAALAGDTNGPVYTSDLLRARQTAQPIAERLGVPLVVRPDLREIGMGAWEGLTEDQAREGDPALHAAWKRDSIANRPPGGESYHDLFERLRAALKEFSAGDPAPVVVTHYSAGRALIATALGAPLEAVRWFRLDNGSLSRLCRTSTGSWQLVALNDLSHLTPGGAPPPYD